MKSKTNVKILVRRAKEEVKEERLIRHGLALDAWLVSNYEQRGYKTPNALVVGLIRSAMESSEAKAA